VFSQDERYNRKRHRGLIDVYLHGEWLSDLTAGQVDTWPSVVSAKLRRPYWHTVVIPGFLAGLQF